MHNILPPVLLIVASKRVWLPLPVICLWPLWIAWLVVGPLLLLALPLRELPWRERVYLPLRTNALLAACRGLKVDVSTADGRHLYLLCW